MLFLVPVSNVRVIPKNKHFFIIIISITFIIFIFTSDGHRATIDEDITSQEALHLATLEPHPNYVQGVSRVFFEYPVMFPPETNTREICKSGLICSYSNIGHSVTEVPFIAINHYLNILTAVDIWELYEYDDPNYAYWKNTLNPDFVFLEIFYGPLLSALTVGVFFLCCRTFNFTVKTSIITSFIFAFSTLIWSYSQTSFNTVPVTLFILLGFLFFLKYTKEHKKLFLILCGSILAFGYLSRPDTVIIAIVLFSYLVIDSVKSRGKFLQLFYFSVPLALSFAFSVILAELRFTQTQLAAAVFAAPVDYPTPFYVGIAGLLFSPGVGLFIFVPISFMAFLSFLDFFKREKSYCILFIVIISSFLAYYSTLEFWHGLTSWGPRYLVPIIPFLLLPLAASIEKRKNKSFLFPVLVFSVVGFFFNFVNIIQNVPWFIWGEMGDVGVAHGLYALGRTDSGLVWPIWINPLVLYTFEFSQLTHAIIWSIVKLQPDIFLLELLESWYSIILISLLSVPVFLLIRQLKKVSQALKTEP